ncbi:MAG: hypothetical protein J5685_11780 [Clostridiales bacterium]|nr:hypothetical protein [Clostridiales bacterium]
MKTKANIISILITVLIILTIGMITISNLGNKNCRTDVPVTVSDNQIISSGATTFFFDTDAETCNLSFDINGMEAFEYQIFVSVGSFDAEPVYSMIVSDNSAETGAIMNNGNDVAVMVVPKVKDGAVLEDSEYYIHYSVVLHSNPDPAAARTLIIVTVLFLLAFGIFVVAAVNKGSEKQFDERQIKSRGVAAMNAFLVTLIVSMGFAFVSRITDSFPLSIFESGMIITLTGVFTFLMHADANDAFIGMKGKRKPLSIVYTVVGIVELLMFGFYSMVFGAGFMDEAKVLTLITGLFFTLTGIEMIIKGIREKQEEKEDEES